MEQRTPPSLSFLEDKLDAARRAGLLRERRGPAGAGSLSYCSNDYLGLADRPGGGEQAGCGGSRLVYGDLAIHARLEAASAELVGQPRALTFTSGYAANMGVLSALAGPGDVIVSDALNHASIVDGARLSRARIVIVPHLDVDATERALAAHRSGRAFVVTESYFSMDADSPDLRALRDVCDSGGAALIVDEAHALGVLGPEGRGLCAAAGIEADVVVGTYGKAFGAAGAFAAGCEALAAWLWSRSRPFVFSTGLSPVLAATALEGLRRAQSEPGRRARVLASAQRLRSGMLELGVRLRGHGPIMPWVVGEANAAMAIAEALQREGVDVRAIRPPSVPEHSARLRLTVTAAHRPEDIDSFLDVVRRLAERGIIPGRATEASGTAPRGSSGPGRARPAHRSGRAPLVVVTGTGTGIGKTHVAEAILRAWARSRPGARLVGLKPIESGVSGEAATDAQRLASASTFHVKQEGYALSAPLSPHLAARLEGVDIDLERVVGIVDRARDASDIVVLELPGGLFTPIARGKSNGDLLTALAPTTTLLVAPDRLGVLHDVAAVVRAACAAGLHLKGVILVAPQAPDASTGRNAAELPATTGVELLASVPRAAATEIARMPEWAGLLPADTRSVEEQLRFDERVQTGSPGNRSDREVP